MLLFGGLRGVGWIYVDGVVGLKIGIAVVAGFAGVVFDSGVWFWVV